MEQEPFLHHSYQRMSELTLPQQQYLEWAERFLWAEALDFTEALTHERKRWKRTEYTLPLLVKRGLLKAVKHGPKLVYTIPGKRGANTAGIDHGLVCTRCLLRFLRSRDGEVVSERFFRGMHFGAVPEWGLIYPTGMLLFEYSTADNFRRGRLMNKKVNQYKDSLPQFEEYFESQVIILFVIEAPQHEVAGFVRGKSGLDDFYFVDLASFMEVEIGAQLMAPIYIWGGDGEKYPLT